MIVQAIQALIVATDVFLKMGKTLSYMYVFFGCKAPAFVGDGPINKEGNGTSIAVLPLQRSPPNTYHQHG